jgi:hypothetical protein
MVSSGVVSSPGSSSDPDPEAARSGLDRSLDHLGSRRLTGKEEWFWYLAAAVTYIAFGIWQKFFLNWFVGPLWLVAFVVVGPVVWDRIRDRTNGDGS